jgi:hypothetical protein
MRGGIEGGFGLLVDLWVRGIDVGISACVLNQYIPQVYRYPKDRMWVVSLSRDQGSFYTTLR